MTSDRSPWKWGWFYYDTGDKSLFVPRRSRYGYTLNVGHPFAWLWLSLIGLVVLASLFMPYFLDDTSAVKLAVILPLCGAMLLLMMWRRYP